MTFDGLILAGGKSSRMGRDKAFLLIDGKPLWEIQAERLRKVGIETIYLSRHSSDHCLFPGVRTILDPVLPDDLSHKGPLAGLVSALERMESTHLVVLAVDLPNMTEHFLKKLMGLTTEQCGVVPQSKNGLFEPLAATYPKGLYDLALAQLTGGQLALQTLVKNAIAKGLVTPMNLIEQDLSLFKNWNSSEDLT
ncbi:MAG: molybdenum cofactor guanylyltransferase [Verrucomicrobiota bacterium]|nr:molybdenum cofactor guanylyltransferase [Verrucomicrobiota bacterium]